MTTEREAREIATDLMNAHDLFDWTFIFDNARRRAGVCDFDARSIALSRHFTALNNPHAVRMTMLHEIAHAIVGSGHGHDRVWKRTCLAIGGDGNRCLNSDSVNQAPSPWIGTCSVTPGHVYPRFKMTESARTGSYSCTKCPGSRITWTRNPAYGK